MMWYYYASSEGIKFKLLTILSAAEEAELELTYTARQQHKWQNSLIN